MPNDQLKSALIAAELQPEDLAARVQVDTKTVQRWLGGATIPHARHRAKVADTLQVAEHELWPEHAHRTGPKDDRSELLGIYASANDIRAPDWRTLLYAANRTIQLLDSTLTDQLLAPGVPDLLGHKADAGTTIQILIAHPRSIWITTLAQALGQPVDDHGDTAVDRELRRSYNTLTQLARHPNIDIHTHWAEHANTILRFDEQMLVNLHLHAHTTTDAPLLHLQRRSPNGLFAQFISHLYAITEHASEPLPAS